MEKFESYNALICDLSIHSNHQAPLQDIGQGFASANCIRHLISGGKIQLKDCSKAEPHSIQAGVQPSNMNCHARVPKVEDFCGIGPEVATLLKQDEAIYCFCAFPLPNLVDEGKGFCTYIQTD